MGQRQLFLHHVRRRQIAAFGNGNFGAARAPAAHSAAPRIYPAEGIVGGTGDGEKGGVVVAEGGGRRGVRVQTKG